MYLFDIYIISYFILKIVFHIEINMKIMSSFVTFVKFLIGNQSKWKRIGLIKAGLVLLLLYVPYRCFTRGAIGVPSIHQQKLDPEKLIFHEYLVKNIVISRKHSHLAGKNI